MSRLDPDYEDNQLYELMGVDDYEHPLTPEEEAKTRWQAENTRRLKALVDSPEVQERLRRRRSCRYR